MMHASFGLHYFRLRTLYELSPGSRSSAEAAESSRATCMSASCCIASDSRLCDALPRANWEAEQLPGRLIRKRPPKLKHCRPHIKPAVESAGRKLSFSHRRNMSSPATVPKLFQPIKVGGRVYAHRVVMAPLTRNRANKAHVHGDLAVEYYGQRATVPGTLIITEATFIAAKAGGYRNVPGIWSEEQVVAWKRVTDAVHGNGSRIFCQLWALGRAADPQVLEEEDSSFSFVSPSDIPMTGSPKAPRPLTISEIKEYIELYTSAAKNAIRAGFDGVELHGANGYLVDQFLQDVSNKRTDEYGGSIENRSRFALEIIDSVTNVIGEKRMGIRLSPWGDFQDMRMPDPKPTFSYLVSQIAARHPNFAYIHVVEARTNGNRDRVPEPGEDNDFLRKIWAPRRFISAGGHSRETAFETAEKNGDLVAFGRFFISHPDLPLRLAQNLPISKGDRDTYYSKEDPHGYIDYPFTDDTPAKL